MKCFVRPQKFIFITVFLLLIQGGKAQEIEYFIDKSLEDIDFSKHIPSLDSLKTMAWEHSPLLKYHDADIEYFKVNESLERRKWLDYIYADANYNYGMFNYLNSEHLAGLPAANQNLINTEASRYTVGMTIKVPISAIFNRKKSVQAETALYERAKFDKEVARQELERALILTYNELLKAHKLLFISGTMLDTYKVQSMRAETDYKNGLISISEYTRLQQQMNQSFKEFERQKSEFLLAYMYLENTIGAKLELE